MKKNLKYFIAPVVILLFLGIILAQQPVSQGPQAGSAAAWLVNISQWAGSTLAAPSNYGTAPSGLVPGVNAYVTNQTSSTPVTGETGATSVYHVISSTSTYNTAKSSAGNLYGIYAFNPNTVPCYIVFYNSTGPTIGTTAIITSYGVQAGLTVSIPPEIFAMSNFSTGITFATTTTDGGASLCTTGLSTDVFYE